VRQAVFAERFGRLPDDALVAVLGLQICNLGLYRLGEQGSRPIAQDSGKLLRSSALAVGWSTIRIEAGRDQTDGTQCWSVVRIRIAYII
jgi:hypothetical protein